MSKPNQNYKIKNDSIRKIIRKIRYNIIPHNRVFLLKKMIPNSICAEIGVEEGLFSEQILKYTKPKKLHLIDIDISKLYSKFKDLSIVEFNEGPSKKILKEFKDEYFDWVYIDGDHSYEGCTSDLELSFQKVKNHGYITGDNFHNAWHGVLKAVVDFIIKYPVQLIEIKNTQFIIKKIVRNINENLMMDLIKSQDFKPHEFILYLDHQPLKLKSVKITKLNTTNDKNRDLQSSHIVKFGIKAILENTSLIRELSNKMSGPNTVLRDLKIKTKFLLNQHTKNITLIVNLLDIVKNKDVLEVSMNVVETTLE